MVEAADSGGLLLVLPLCLDDVGGELYIDGQARNGLAKWLDNFETITLACPVTRRTAATSSTLPLDGLAGRDRVTFVALPLARSPLQFLRHLTSTAAVLAGLIESARYPHFAIGGIWGDWGAVGGLIASRMGRRYAVWTDRVESQVIRFQASRKSALRRLNGHVNATLTEVLERAVIRRSSLGLFHGMDCFTAYAGFSSNPHLVDDIHFGQEAQISESELVSRLGRSGPMRFIYAGRAHGDKGIFDWIDVFSELAARRRDFLATWYGDGPELDRARAIVLSRELGGVIELPGSISHSEMLLRMKDADAFVFCHKTPESPRCLGEALASGLPLVGYRSDYAAHLVAQNAGARLSVKDDIGSLTAQIEGLFDRAVLRELSFRAARDGIQFTSDAVFKHRSDLMKGMIEPGQ